MRARLREACKSGGPSPARHAALARGGVCATAQPRQCVAATRPTRSEAAAARATDSDSDGIDSDGIDSDGIDSDGIDSDGIDSDGIDSDGIDSDSDGPSRGFLLLAILQPRNRHPVRDRASTAQWPGATFLHVRDHAQQTCLGAA